MTTLIKNIQLIDGTGKSPIKTDVLVKANLISAIGNLVGYRANETIDGMGWYLAPGFIDIHTTKDRYLDVFSDSEAENLLKQGVTTIIGGQDGISLAPLLYGSLELVKDWTDIRKINVNWHTVAEFLKVLEKKSQVLNFGTMVGYQTIENSLKGADVRNLTQNELKVFIHILDKALSEGAFGLSIGSNYTNKNSAAFYDLKLILKIIARHRALFVTELEGQGEEQISSLNRVINLVEEAGVKSRINHLEPIIGFEPVYEKIIETISVSSAKADILFDVYPADISVMPIYAMLPRRLFSKDKNESENLEEILKILKNNDSYEQIRKELPKLKLNDIKILSVPDHKYLSGTLLRTYSKNRSLTLSQGLLDLFRFTRGRAIISYKNINEDYIKKAIANDRAIIASADAHTKAKKEFSFLNFLKLIEKEKIIPIETAVRKLTGLPAQRLSLKARGLIKIGYVADLVIFKGSEVREVIINGKRAIKDSKVQNVKSGKILRHGH